MVDPLIPLVWSLNLGPLKSAQSFEKAAERMNLNSRQAAIKRVCDTVVDAEARGRFAMIGRKSRLIETVVSKPQFISPTRTRRPGPSCAEYLRARVDQRQPLRLKLNRIIHGPGIVSEEIGTGQRISVIDVVVDLSDRVVRSHGIGKSGYIARGRGVVQRKACAVTGNRRSQSAASHFQAHRADWNATGLQVGDHVRDAVGAIAGKNESTISGRRQRNHRWYIDRE